MIWLNHTYPYAFRYDVIKKKLRKLHETLEFAKRLPHTDAELKIKDAFDEMVWVVAYISNVIYIINEKNNQKISCLYIG